MNLTKEQAISLYESKFWEDMTYRQRAEFQITEERLCMPFDIFHEAVEKTLNRPVFIYEFGLNLGGLKNELFNGAEPPTFEQILELIPENRRLLILNSQETTK